MVCRLFLAYLVEEAGEGMLGVWVAALQRGAT
jgi:hypothetical protein